MSVNIVLIGLMGAGKTTVGKYLAGILQEYTFVDVDEEIEKRENKKISQIFEEKSEEYFRELETDVIENIVQNQNQVISIGGGAFEKEKNRELLLKNSKVFYLKAGTDTLFERIKGDNTRPLLNCENPKDKLKKLLEIREVNYKKAHFIIETDNKTIDEIKSEIIKEI